MFIHGKLFLTEHGIMLDEARSLLQKALRRKEQMLTLKVTKELLAYEKDQLPWKSLVTFLFEDHCLNDAAVLAAFFEAFEEGTRKAKYRCVQMLLNSKTCRIAACLPVIALDESREPKNFNEDIEVRVSLRGLVEEGDGLLKIDQILEHLLRAWTATDHELIITYMKLCSMVVDLEQNRRITPKGVAYLIIPVKRKKPHFGLVVMSALYKNTDDAAMRVCLRSCHHLATIPDVCIRLILFAAVTRLKFGSSEVPASADPIDWSTVPQLTMMPNWAVDKHTFRGKFGRGTKTIKNSKTKMPSNMTEEEYEEFHGIREKNGVQHFFTEGVLCENEAVAENPYWEQTKEIYLTYPQKQQKTVRMTELYSQKLMRMYPALFHSNKINISSEMRQKRSCDKLDQESSLPKRPRLAYMGSTHNDEVNMVDKVNLLKRPCLVSHLSVSGSRHRTIEVILPELSCPDPNPLLQPSTKTHTCETEEETTVAKQTYTVPQPSTSINRVGAVELKSLPKEPSPDPQPLMQVPTSRNKVHTVANLQNGKVIKGPYRNGSMFHRVAFLHNCMHDILSDPHTLAIKVDPPYMIFPLITGDGATMENTRINYRDCIARKDITDATFLSRESLGIVQLHRLSCDQIAKLPMSVWAHFIFRFALNIGDSGLYNAITDSKLSFVYGIDMEEQRSKIKSSKNIFNVIFSKAPRKDLCNMILASIRSSKIELNGLVSKEIDHGAIETLAHKWNVHYDREMFTKRIVHVCEMLEL